MNLLTKYESLVILALNTVLLSSCSDQFVKGVYIGSNNEYSLNVQTSSLQNIPAGGGAIKTRIESSNSVEWEIQNLTDWLSASTVSGTGSQDIIFNVSPNESFTSSRTHIFNIVTTNSDWSVSVPVSATQQKKSINFSYTPSDNVSWTFDSEGGNKELRISSNIDWTAENDDAFVTLSKKSGSGDATMIIAVTPYKYVDVLTNRTSNIYFKNTSDGEVLQVLTITQTPLQTSVDSETVNIDFDKNSNSRSFSYGEVNGTYSVTSDAPWLNITKNKDNAIDITISVAANENDEERTSNAYVYLDESNAIRYVFTVKQQGNVIVIDPKSINCDANAGTYTVTVSSTSPWKATNINDWISVQESTGTCVVSISENNSLNSRSGEILFNRTNPSGDIYGKTVKLVINQKSRTINADNETLQFGPEASTQLLNIESDAQWTLAATESWIHLSATEGLGNKNITVSVDENTTSSNRMGKLSLACLGKVIEINVIQESAYINTSSTAIELDAAGGLATVSLTSNISWTATSSASWLSVTPTSGSGKCDLELSASYNLTSSQRTAVVTISSSLGDIKINVRQNAPSISVSQNSVTFDYFGGESSPIVITADGDYTVTTSANWINYTESGNTIKISVKENEGELRTGTVKLDLRSANVSATINVTQKAAPYSFVDLGLPSGTKWCSWNLGATSKEEYGSYHKWVDAKQQIPDGCAMPTYEQANELISNCSWTWSSVNLVAGYLGKGPNGNTIFLPAGGYYEYSTNPYYNGKLSYVGNMGEFWINYDNTSEYSRYPTALIIQYMHSAGVPPKISGDAQAAKLNVRCVKK